MMYLYKKKLLSISCTSAIPWKWREDLRIVGHFRSQQYLYVQISTKDYLNSKVYLYTHIGPQLKAAIQEELAAIL